MILDLHGALLFSVLLGTLAVVLRMPAAIVLRHMLSSLMLLFASCHTSRAS
jgi:heme A synthase